jgi:peptide/nickel transport system permease protein
MRSYLARRLLLLVPVLLGVSVVVFLVLHLSPGDPAEIMLGSQATQDDLERLRRELGLTEPLHVQYFHWVTHVARGDLGRSLWMKRPVLDEVLNRYKATLVLTASGLLLSTLGGIVLGVSSAVRPHSLLDRASAVTSLFGASMPVFWLGIVLMVIFSLWLGWLPASGMWAPYGGGGLRDLLAHLVLPAVTLAAASLTIIARLTRSTMLDILSQDYIRTARAKGLVEGRVIFRHGLKNALIPIVTGGGRAGGLSAGRRRAHGDGLRVAGGGTPHGPGHPRPRFPPRAGLRARHRPHLRADQPRRRSALRLPRSANPV